MKSIFAEVLILLLCLTPCSEGGQVREGQTSVLATSSEPPALPETFDGPPPPVAPDTISRDESGRATVRAVRLEEPLRVDGLLDEAVYSEVPPASGFYQMEPQWGEPATQQTEVWIFFNDENLYATARVWESDPERMVLNEWRRDSPDIFQNEIVGFMFDTFFDRRNAIVFNVTALGAVQDAQVTDERDWNADWNPVYRTATERFPGGWSVETEIPFKSLRYNTQRHQVWGFNVQRNNRWKNELSFLVPLPRAWQTLGIMRPSGAATIVGIEVPEAGKALDVKPFVVSRMMTDRLATPAISNEFNGDLGLDVKWGATRGLTADFTYNTDFAQAEADQVQTNLSRLSLFFPEKREFFLENRGIFTFGGVGGQTPVLFYSRRIGLNDGHLVPIQGGGRLTGKVGPYSLGVLSIRQDEDSISQVDPTTFSVVRVRRDLFGRGAIGAMVTDRSVARSGAGRHESYGVDAQFIFLGDLAVNAYWAQTRPTEGSVPEDSSSHRAQLDYQGDRFGFQVDHLSVGAGFNPEIGFVPRGNMRRMFVQPRVSVRPQSSAIVRRYNYTAWLEHISNKTTGEMESRELRGEFSIDLQNSDIMKVFATHNREMVLRPFTIGPNAKIPAGRYDFHNVHSEYTLGQQRKFSGTVYVEHGSFYGGQKTSLGLSSSPRLKLSSRLSIEPRLILNRVTLPQQSFSTRLITANAIYGLAPSTFVTARLQYNSDARIVSSNLRFRWEYQPGSELFVVYNDQRDTEATMAPGLKNRSLIIKVNRLFRF